MTSLESQFLDITFPNPYILAAGPPTANGSIIREAFKEGWGGAVIKTLGLEATTPLTCPRLFVIKNGRHKMGMGNTELITELTIEEWREDVDRIRQEFPDRPLIASITAGGELAEWPAVVERLGSQGIDAFEMMVSCPNITDYGQSPETLGQAIRAVRGATDLPITVKLTPNVTDIVSIAKVCREAGADAVTATDTVSGLAGVDLDQFIPLPKIHGKGMFSGYSGPGIKPVSLRCVASIAKFGGIPLFGCGGIMTWKDAAEFMTVGASVVQVCTAVMWKGAGMIQSLNSGLEGYLEEHGFQSPAELIGKALPALADYPAMNIETRLVAEVDLPACTGCGICARGCESGGYQAIEMQDKKAIIDLEKCDGCGLCVGVCPVDCMRMVGVE
jgi:dihydropyrimidine dehydrogenase (NAD+) subunit PreA